MSDITSALKIATDVDVNHEDLGAWLAREGSDDQAAFLRGFTRELSNWAYLNTDHQLMYIADALGDKYGDDARRDVHDVLTRIAGFMDKDES